MLSCAICQSGINDSPADNNYPWVVSCGHIYHKHCITQSLGFNTTCPQCRKEIRSNFRIYPEINDKDDTIRFLQECIKSAELQYDRQKKISDDKDALITRVQTLNDEVETRNTELRTSNVDYMNRVEKVKEQLNTNIAKLKKDKSILNKKVTKLEEKISNHESIVSQLKTKLKEKEDQLAAASESEEVARTCHRQQILVLERKLESYTQEATARDKLKSDQIVKLKVELDETKFQYSTACEAIKNLSERPAVRAPDPAVDELARGLEAATIARPLRKRKSSSDYSPYSTKKVESSPKRASSDDAAEDVEEPEEKESGSQSGSARASGGEAPAPTKYYGRKIIKVVRKKAQ